MYKKTFKNAFIYVKKSGTVVWCMVIFSVKVICICVKLMSRLVSFSKRGRGVAEKKTTTKTKEFRRCGGGLYCVVCYCIIGWCILMFVAVCGVPASRWCFFIFARSSFFVEIKKQQQQQRKRKSNGDHAVFLFVYHRSQTSFIVVWILCRGCWRSSQRLKIINVHSLNGT